MDSQEVFGGFGRKGSRLRCFVIKLIWPSWNCGQFDGMYVEIGYAWISMVIEEVKGFKYFKILEYPPIFGSIPSFFDNDVHNFNMYFFNADGNPTTVI